MTDRLHTLLFDLDGTLLDTAPDLADALNAILMEEGQPPRTYETIRPVVSHGAAAIVSFGFDMTDDDTRFAGLRQRFLDHYRRHIARRTRLFPGMEEVLQTIEQRGMNWGVVTNKPAWLTDPLLQALDLYRRTRCVVSGDTVEQRKPHPAPLLHACNLAGSAAGQCLYIGDAQRDIEAGNRAGMHTLIALFGYIGSDETPEYWGADGMISNPHDILVWVDRLTNHGAR
ncbi:MAG: phosphoglycolate phosphatase [Gammaproteobacteria bacterium RBG_16_57_12]|nr:MAG: phosphoglycolate phosphatase [Gammaproteobacteria bacterium RBG_16_57_12]